MFPIIITIPRYIKEAKLSNSQRAIYWEWDGKEIKAKNKKLLQRYIEDKEGVILNNGLARPEHLKKQYKIIDKVKTGRLVQVKHYLADAETEELIIANINQVGKPRLIKIKGQDIYSGNVREFTRGVIMDQIKDNFRPYVERIPRITEYPLEIVCEVHTPVKNINDRAKEGVGGRWDVDNHAYPYLKSFPDLLLELDKIEDDDRLHITIPPHAVYYPCEREEDRKLVFKITRDVRPVILNNKHYGDKKISKLVFKRL